MNTKNTLLILLIFLLAVIFMAVLSFTIVDNHELKTKIDRGVVSHKKITPEIELTTDGKTVDTLYIYKWKEY